MGFGFFLFTVEEFAEIGSIAAAVALWKLLSISEYFFQAHVFKLLIHYE
jgi:hypothetical protein